MIFLDYRPLVSPLILLLAIGAGIFVFRSLKDCRPIILWPCRIISTLLIGLCGLLLMVFGFFFFFFDVTTASVPVYSPDGRQAFRVVDYDAGALGGNTAVMVYSHHGLYSHALFSGQWKQAELANVRWIGNSVVSVGYHTDYGSNSFRCASGYGVAVICTPLPIRKDK